MKIKSEKGITGVDITVTILIITLFVAFLTNLFYSLNSNSNSVQRRTEATHKAINIIENLKNEFKYNEQYKNLPDGVIEEGYIDNGPYYKKISVIDFASMPENQGKDIVSNIIKKVTVEVSYKDQNNNEAISLSAIINVKE